MRDAHGNIHPLAGAYTRCTPPITNAGHISSFSQTPDLAHMILPQSFPAGVPITRNLANQTTLVQAISQPLPHVIPPTWGTNGAVPRNPTISSQGAPNPQGYYFSTAMGNQSTYQPHPDNTFTPPHFQKSHMVTPILITLHLHHHL